MSQIMKKFKQILANLLPHEILLHFLLGFLIFFTSYVFTLNHELSLLITTVVAITVEVIDAFSKDNKFDMVDMVATIVPAVLSCYIVTL